MRLLKRIAVGAGCASRACRLSVAVFGVLCALSVTLAQAASLHAAPSATPTIRVDTTMHTALVRRIAYDASRERLVSASDDKTVRIWSLHNGRLERTLRVPIDKEHEGQLFALAVSPDGSQIAVGGWTCWDWDQAACVYIFSSDEGALIHRIDGFPDAIGALAWSPDGRTLAVGLQGRGGLRLLRTDTFAEIARDAEYNDKLMELAFDRTGRLASASFDGMIRVYGTDHRLLARVRVPGGAKPASVRFSTDGSQVAVGMIDAPVVVSFATRDLSVIAQRRAPAGSEQISFSSVAWSHDGAFIYSAGERKSEGTNYLWKWPARSNEASHEAPARIALPTHRVSELQALPRGRVAFSSEDPRLGVLEADGQLALDRGPEVADYSRRESALHLSADGRTVAYQLRPGAPVRQFSTDRREGIGMSDAPVLHARAEAPGWRIENWRDSFTPRINGHTPTLDDYELVRSYALAHDDSALLLGTEWAVRLLDRQARERWRVKLPAIAWAVNIARDGKLAVAALSDGTIRWYRMSDGAEQLAYFPHANGEDWIAWVPSGYYMSSPHGDQYVGWHINRGKDTAPDYYRAVQFERVLYRPDLVIAALWAQTRTNTRGSTVSPANGFDVSRLLEIAPPRLRIALLPSASPARPHHARIRVSAERTALPMRDFTVFVNDIPVTPSAERDLSADETNAFVREIEIPLFGLDNEIRVESFTGMSMGVAEGFVQVATAKAAASLPSGNLFVLAIGNNQFPNLSAQTQLEYASRDAEEFAATLTRHAPGVFRRTHVQVLSDSRERRADRASIMQAVRFLRFARAEDTVVVFLASHGISDKAGNYYFVPRDATLADMDAISREPARERYDSLVPWTVFFEALRNAAGRRVLIVDTCQARGIEGRFEAYSLMKRSASSRFSLIVAAKADEESQEYEPAQHGLFTYALLQALRPQSDTDGDGRISVRELFDAAGPIVERLHDRATGPQTPQIVLPRALETAALGSVRSEPSARSQADSR